MKVKNKFNFVWNKVVLQEFIDTAILNDDEIYIINAIAKGESWQHQAQHLNISIATLGKMRTKLSIKYDDAQKVNHNLPARL